MEHVQFDEVRSEAVHIPADSVSLAADLAVPGGARGLVIFAHGSGSSRMSPRNRAVAESLRGGGLATLLLDLLTPSEERVDDLTRQHRFDIALLAKRLAFAVVWAARDSRTMALPIGLFGASTGAAAALVAAAIRPQEVITIVSRGGRPDLAGDSLAHVRAPTLLIVGGLDPQVLALNEDAMRMLRCPKRLVVVPGATHLFEEAGTLQQVADLAREWFVIHLLPRRAAHEGRPVSS